MSIDAETTATSTTTDQTAAPADDTVGTEDSDTVVMTVTDEALSTVLGIRAQEDGGDQLALRVAVTGSKGVEYTYDLSFEDLAEVAEGHSTYRVGDLSVAIPVESIELLQGAELDLPRTPGQGGLVIRNPNRPNPLDISEIELSGDIAEKVTQLLEQSINPALASHGGFANLDRVEDDNVVYVTMGGGCQGCSASAATLTEGIRRSILEAIPEVTEVRDATDHAAGENPFY